MQAIIISVNEQHVRFKDVTASYPISHPQFTRVAISADARVSIFGDALKEVRVYDKGYGATYKADDV
jgi:hypothetical protein